VFVALRNVNVVGTQGVGGQDSGGTKLLVYTKKTFHFYCTELTYTRIGNDFVKY